MKFVVKFFPLNRREKSSEDYCNAPAQLREKTRLSFLDLAFDIKGTIKSIGTLY